MIKGVRGVSAGWERTHTRKESLRVKRMGAAVLLVAIVVLSEGLFAQSAYANAGPPTKVEDGDAAFFVPVKHDSIEILSEDLTYDIAVEDESAAYAHIRAGYEMRNTAQDPAHVLVAFVANNPDTPVEITFDGQPIHLQESISMPWNVTGQSHYTGDLLKRVWSNVGSWIEYGAWEPTFEEILRFAGTGHRTGDMNAGYDLELSTFQVTLDPGASHTLSVSYVEDAAVIYERKGYKYVNPKAEFYYFLEPARYWKDFSNLIVTVRLPEGYHLETSLEGFARQGSAYVAQFAELPAKNLRILIPLSSPSLLDKLAKPAMWIACLTVLLRVARRIRRKTGPASSSSPNYH
jgi:hypothetical protein